MRREGRSLRPPIFQKHFLSGVDNGRDGLIRRQFWFSWHQKVDDNPERISGELKETRWNREQAENRRFSNPRLFPQPLLCRETRSLRPPLLREQPAVCRDYGRVWPIED